MPRRLGHQRILGELDPDQIQEVVRHPDVEAISGDAGGDGGFF